MAVFVAILCLVAVAPPSSRVLAGGDQPEPTPTVEDTPPDTVTDFYPEQNDLSDCVGLVERPGCGSDARGGWRQTAVFGVVLLGVSIIIWRITVGVRRNLNSGPPPTDGPTAP